MCVVVVCSLPVFPSTGEHTKKRDVEGVNGVGGIIAKNKWTHFLKCHHHLRNHLVQPHHLKDKETEAQKGTETLRPKPLTSDSQGWFHPSSWSSSP